jgi:hypothetical protein
MTRSRFALAAQFAGALLLSGIVAAGQALTPAVKTNSSKKTWTPPRTGDGHPDFGGVWTNNTITPMERPRALGGREFYTDAELAENQKKESQRLTLNEEEGRPTEAGTAADVHYDFAEYGLDRAQAKLAWNRRTSLIVGPEGTIPPVTAEGRARAAAIAAKDRGHEFDGPENRPLAARCMVFGNVGPPMRPAGYNSNLQIIQGKDAIVIETEMIHDARVVAMNGRPHPPANIRQWYGDAIGHWEGDTLVIDTTNFTDLAPFPGAKNLHVVERLTLVDPETILYQFTIDDSGMWTKPWSGEIPITKIKGQMYEYACHEANYGLANTLSGARVAEADAAQKK